MSDPLSILSSSTQLQHAGKEHRVGRGLVGATEISVTFESATPTSLPIYSRLGNTANHQELETVLAHLHTANQSIATGSGMAALNLIFMTLLKPGDHVLVEDPCYGGTYNLLTKIFSHWGIAASFTRMSDWKNELKANTRMVLFESINNPFCVPQNIGTAVSFAKQHSLLSVCDNTFASPALCQPLSHGVDLVMESATKYLNGHSDVIAGMVAGRDELINILRPPHAYLGTFLATQQCSQLLRGLKTLELRMAAHCIAGAAFANALRAEPSLITEVNYGESNEGSTRESTRESNGRSRSSHLAGQYFTRGYGGMVSVRFASTVDVRKVMGNMRLVTNVPSLGGTETTATMPAYSTNWFMTAEEKIAYKIDDQLVRFSLGLENIQDIIRDVLTAARAAQR
jgi:cystathionine beta-lyase/cystathionine gamma-synthase